MIHHQYNLHYYRWHYHRWECGKENNGQWCWQNLLGWVKNGAETNSKCKKEGGKVYQILGKTRIHQSILSGASYWLERMFYGYWVHLLFTTLERGIWIFISRFSCRTRIKDSVMSNETKWILRINEYGLPHLWRRTVEHQSVVPPTVVLYSRL